MSFDCDSLGEGWMERKENSANEKIKFMKKLAVAQVAGVNVHLRHQGSAIRTVIRKHQTEIHNGKTVRISKHLLIEQITIRSLYLDNRNHGFLESCPSSGREEKCFDN